MINGEVEKSFDDEQTTKKVIKVHKGSLDKLKRLRKELMEVFKWANDVREVCREVKLKEMCVGMQNL